MSATFASAVCRGWLAIGLAGLTGVALAAEPVPRANPKRAVPLAPVVQDEAQDWISKAILIEGIPLPRARPWRPVIVVREAAEAVARATAYAPAAEAGTPVASLFRAADAAADPALALPPSPTAPTAAPGSDGIASFVGLAATAPIRKTPAKAEEGLSVASFAQPGESSAFAEKGRQGGSLKAALDALRRDRYAEVLRRRNGLTDPLDRRIIDYFLIRSGSAQLSSAMIAEYAKGADGWPSAKLVRAEAEAALGREAPAPRRTIEAMGGEAATPAGARLLAKAHFSLGQSEPAARLVRSAWHAKAMGGSLQRAFGRDFASLFTEDDHLIRVDMLVGRDRLSEAEGLREFLSGDARAYLAARLAAARGSGNARSLLASVPSALKRRPGHTLAEVERLRRADDFEAAARLIGAERGAVVAGDAWWVETRIIARSLAERGRGRLAYDLVTKGFATSRTARADEAFHAGWIALSALNNPGAAETHFATLAGIATRPISLSRAAYWRGRAAREAGDDAAARRHFEAAARYGFTYYGQLARAALGRSGTGVPRRPIITDQDRAAFAGNEVAQAVRRLIAAEHEHRVWPLLDHLSETVATAGQVALTAELAREAQAPHLALMVAKEGLRRGLPVGGLAYPTEAIPKSATVPGDVHRAVVYAIARQESSFNAAAVSPAGARGLMQVMPRTAASLARELRLPHSSRRLTSDPAYNVTLGAAYLSKRLADFDGSYILTFAAYNAGAGRVVEWIERFGDPREEGVDPVHWVEQIPYPETRNYVQRVMENVQVYREALGSGRLAIEADLRRGRPS